MCWFNSCIKQPMLHTCLYAIIRVSCCSYDRAYAAVFNLLLLFLSNSFVIPPGVRWPPPAQGALWAPRVPLWGFVGHPRPSRGILEASQVFGVPMDGLLCMGALTPKAQAPLHEVRGAPPRGPPRWPCIACNARALGVALHGGPCPQGPSPKAFPQGPASPGPRTRSAKRRTRPAERRTPVRPGRPRGPPIAR